MVVWSRKFCLWQAKVASFVFLVLFQDGGGSVSPRFNVFVSDFERGGSRERERDGGVQDYLACPHGWEDSSLIFHELLTQFWQGGGEIGKITYP